MKRIIDFGCSNTYGTALDDTKQSWPHVLANLYSCDVDNQGIEGASNLQIPWNILQYPFQEGDVVIIMWSIVNRDFLEGQTQLGVWQNKPVIEQWLAVHSKKDMAIRSWLNIHHAQQYLSNLNIPSYNFAVDHKFLSRYRPPFIGTTLYNANVDFYKFLNKAKDRMHPGPKAHAKIAKKIKEIIDANRY